MTNEEQIKTALKLLEEAYEELEYKINPTKELELAEAIGYLNDYLN